MAQETPVERSSAISPSTQLPEPAPPKGPRTRWLVVGFLVLAALLFFGGRMFVTSMTRESTDDAFIDAHIVSVASQAAGRVQAVHVVDNQLVRQGDLLVEIDPRDYEVKAAQKRASVATSAASHKTVEASFALIQARLQTAEASARQMQAEAEASKAVSERAQADLKRARELRDRNVVSAQEFDTTTAATTAANSNYEAARQKAAAEVSKVAEVLAQVEAAKTLIGSADAQLAQSKTDLQAAEIDLSYTRIVAPHDGRVTRKMVEPGGYVQLGQTILAIVPPEMWVTANFKETQLAGLRVGQRAEIEISAFQEEYPGHIESIQSGSGARFSLLPPENAVGNYVKVVQRVPVKIVFDQPIGTNRVAGPGMSAVPRVVISDFSLSPLVLLAAAVGVAAVVMFLVGGLLRKRAAG